MSQAFLYELLGLRVECTRPARVTLGLLGVHRVLVDPLVGDFDRFFGFLHGW